MSKKIYLCGINELQSGTVQKFIADGNEIALARIDNDFYAIGDHCSHANYFLSEGELLVGEKELECWKHGSTFSLISGKPTCLPATKAVPVYDVVVEGDRVMVVIS